MFLGVLIYNISKLQEIPSKRYLNFPRSNRVEFECGSETKAIIDVKNKVYIYYTYIYL